MGYEAKFIFSNDLALVHCPRVIELIGMCASVMLVSGLFTLRVVVPNP
jgi:hypothetical protein